MSPVVPAHPDVESVDDLTDLSLCCPACGKPAHRRAANADLELDEFECTGCGMKIRNIEGVWRALPAARAAEIESALSDYERVRRLEGRRSDDPDYYRSLPWHDTTGLFRRQWMIRSRSFAFVLRHILPAEISRLKRERLHILDLGAGNCWMSYRLALAGHDPVAVDISVNRDDGLGAAAHYQSALDAMFPRFQADMDNLPFAAGQFDLVVLNASFHYSRDYRRTIREARRVLAADGAVLIIDSPTYLRDSDGQAMTREKSVEFSRRFGTANGTMGGRQYLTPDRLKDLEPFGIRWSRYAPWYGWRWALRPAIARITGRRSPSRFYIYLGLPDCNGGTGA